MAEKGKSTEDSKVFDVEKPGKAKPDMGSKPMIVGHKSMAGDPMMKEKLEAEKVNAAEDDKAKMAKSTSERKIEPISDDLKSKKEDVKEKAPEKEEKKPEKEEKPASDKKTTTTGKDKGDKDKELEPAAVAMEREENLNKIIKNKKYQVDIKEKKSGSFKTFLYVFFGVVVAGFLAIYVLIDTNTIESDIDLPFRIFGSEEAEEVKEIAEETEEKTAQQDKVAEETVVERQKITELDEPIVLEKLGDEEKLPEETPSSFVAYIKATLATIEEDCPIVHDDMLPGYVVSKISDRYIEGSGSCGGSGHMDWYFLNDVWNELPQQAVVNCSKVIETTIPTEFMEGCFDEETQEIIDNPNGSYYDQEV